MGLGAGLGGGRRALRLHHAGVGEYEVGGVGSGGWSGCGNHRSVQAVSVRAVHPTTDPQADGFDDRALAFVLVVVIRLLFHHHRVHGVTVVHSGSHGQRQRATLLLLGLVLLLLVVPRLMVAIFHGKLANGIVGDQHELQLVFLLLQSLNLLLKVGFLLLQFLSLLFTEAHNEPSACLHTDTRSST